MARSDRSMVPGEQSITVGGCALSRSPDYWRLSAAPRGRIALNSVTSNGSRLRFTFSFLWSMAVSERLRAVTRLRVVGGLRNVCLRLAMNERPPAGKPLKRGNATQSTIGRIVRAGPVWPARPARRDALSARKAGCDALPNPTLRLLIGGHDIRHRSL